MSTECLLKENLKLNTYKARVYLAVLGQQMDPKELSSALESGMLLLLHG